MPYRAPRFSHVHAARDGLGVAGISLSAGAAHGDFPLDNLFDDRAGTLFKWLASETDPSIIIDLGAGFITGIRRLIIPADHNIDTVTIEDDDAIGFPSPETLHSSDTSPTPGTLYDSGIFNMANSAQRFIRVTFTGTKQFFLPQLFLTKITTLGVGPDLRSAPDRKLANVSRQNQPTGQSPTVQLGPQQRQIEYSYDFPLSDADLTAIETLIDAVGLSRPFYVDPASFSSPPETDEPALWMKFGEMPRTRYSILVPLNGTRSKNVTLQLVESLD